MAPAPLQQQRSVGLNWDGRWGKWQGGSVNVLAACVVDLEVLVRGDGPCSPELGRKVAQEVGILMRDQLTEEAFCVNIHWVPRSSRNRHTLRLAMLCDPILRVDLQRAWRQRLLCGGLATVTWQRFADTADPMHGTSVDRALAGRKPHSSAETSFLLELPARWLSADLDQAGGQQSCSFSKGSHWHNFAGLFGEVVHAEILLVDQDPSVVSYLARFVSCDGSYAMYEALVERYLCRGMPNTIDAHPAICATGKYDDLRRRAQQPSGVVYAAFLMRYPPPVNGTSAPASLASPPPASVVAHAAPHAAPHAGPPADLEEGFVLRRSGLMEDPSCAPAMIYVTPSRPRVILGRDEQADMLLRRPHVSKLHATLDLQPPLNGRGWKLRIQDTSVNGTWVNGRRLGTEPETLEVGAQITFLPSNHNFYRDALAYEVAASRGCSRGPPQAAVAVAAEVAASVGTESRRDGEDARQSADAAEPVAKVARHHSQGVPWIPAAADGRFGAKGEVTARVDARAVNGGLPQEVVSSVAADPSSELLFEASAAAAASTPPRSCQPDDIGVWLASLDGGSLMMYEAMLRSLFDDVPQIRELYQDRLHDFFEDVIVKDPNHRLAFASALRALR